MTHHFTTELLGGSGPRPLTGGWHLRLAGGPAPHGIAGRLIPASVPGSIREDLLAAGLPAQHSGSGVPSDWIERCRWEYSLDFPWHGPGAPAELAFKDLDAGASVQLNGQALDHSRLTEASRHQVGAVLFEGINTLRVSVPASPVSTSSGASASGSAERRAA